MTNEERFARIARLDACKTHVEWLEQMSKELSEIINDSGELYALIGREETKRRENPCLTKNYVSARSIMKSLGLAFHIVQ